MDSGMPNGRAVEQSFPSNDQMVSLNAPAPPQYPMSAPAYPNNFDFGPQQALFLNSRPFCPSIAQPAAAIQSYGSLETNGSPRLRERPSRTYDRSSRHRSTGNGSTTQTNGIIQPNSAHVDESSFVYNAALGADHDLLNVDLSNMGNSAVFADETQSASTQIPDQFSIPSSQDTSYGSNFEASQPGPVDEHGSLPTPQNIPSQHFASPVNYMNQDGYQPNGETGQPSPYSACHNFAFWENAQSFARGPPLLPNYHYPRPASPIGRRNAKSFDSAAERERKEKNNARAAKYRGKGKEAMERSRREVEAANAKIERVQRRCREMMVRIVNILPESLKAMGQAIVDEYDGADDDESVSQPTANGGN